MKRRTLFLLILGLSYLSLMFNSSEARQHNDENEDGGSNKLLMGIGVGVGAVAGVCAAPLVLSAAGFTAGGVALGSMAATVQSVFYGGAAAGGFSALQSAGAAGLGMVGTAVAGSVGAGLGAGAAKVADSVSDKSTKNQKNVDTNVQ